MHGQSRLISVLLCMTFFVFYVPVSVSGNTEEQTVKSAESRLQSVLLALDFLMLSPSQFSVGRRGSLRNG